MAKIKGIKESVLYILENDEKARNSDRYLYVAVVKMLTPELATLPFYEALAHMEIPNSETVRRCRQELQAKYKHLRANDTVEAMRELNEEEYRREFGRGWLDKVTQKNS